MVFSFNYTLISMKITENLIEIFICEKLNCISILMHEFILVFYTKKKQIKLNSFSKFISFLF
jgi:hypothetical protein